MKIKKIIPLILVATLLLVIVILGWNKNNKSNELNTLKTPSKINLYYNGEKKEIVRNTLNQDLFGNICELIVFQMPQIVGVDNSSIISDTVVNEIKTYAVEYIYNKPQNIKVNDGDDVKRVQYTELLFAMSEKHEENVYMKTTDNTYLFIGIRPNIKYMVKNMF